MASDLPQQQPWWARLTERTSLLVLLTIVGLRPLIAESYDLAGLAMTSALAGLGDPLPLRTLWIDVAILAAATAWALAHALRPSQRYRWCRLEFGLLLVIAAAVVSCNAAANRRTAINASVDWVCTAAVALVLAQLLRGRGDVRLALCTIVASAAAQAYQCFDQVLVGFAQTERLYLEQREAFWQAQGVPLDSHQVELFENRLQAREASGYLAHSNVAGAYLLLTFFAALAWAAGCRPRARAPDWGGRVMAYLAVAATGGVTLFLLGAMALTHSLGALLACAGGLTLWAVRYVGRRWIESNRVLALSFGWGLVAGAGLAVAVYGLTRGTLPVTTLNFRWGYWTASAGLISDHRWTGVGRENFGDAYLQYKTIDLPEEVKNPHNFLVGAAADWGVLGLVGVVGMLVGGSIAVTRPMPRFEPARRGIGPDGASTNVRSGRMVLGMAVLGPAIFGLRLGLLGSEDPNYLFVETALPMMVWLAAFAVFAFGPTVWQADGLQGWLRMAVVLNCGLFAFLLQDTINFALIVPGSATTFFALVGVAVALRAMPEPGRPAHPTARSREARWAPAVLSGLALVIVLAFIVPPVWRATGLVEQARSRRMEPPDGPLDRHAADVAYRAAMAADRFDPTAAAERAAWLFQGASSSLDPVTALREAVASMSEAVARSPSNVSYHRRRAMMLYALAERTQDPADRARALEAAQRAIELYPARPASYVELAELEIWIAQAEKRVDLMESAVKHYQYALQLDGQRPAWEAIRRFNLRRVSEIKGRIAEAQAWLDQNRSSPQQGL